MASVSFEQNKNTMMLIPQYLPEKTRAAFGIGPKDVGKEKVYAFQGRRRLEAITSASRSSEGNRPSFFLANEVHHFLASNGGHDMFDVVERNATKSKDGATRTLSITNAFMPGEQSIAEKTRDAYMKTITINPETGKAYSLATGILYDSLEAPSYAPLTPDAAPYVLEKVRGDSVWLDIERIVQSIMDPRNPPSRSRRFWYNQVTADEEALIGPDEWDAIAGCPPLKDNDEIVLGFDGGRTDDASALVAIRISDRSIHPLSIWEKPPGPSLEAWEVNRSVVDDKVAHTFGKYRVRAFFSDVSQWESFVDIWSDRYRDTLIVKAVTGKSTVGYDMRGHQEEITRINEGLVGAVREGSVSHNGDLTLRAHVLNTRSRVNQYGMTFDKVGGPESSRKNDGYAATLLAYIALNRYLESGKRPKEHSGKFWMF